MLASYRGHVEIVELLLLYDSDVNLTTQVKLNFNTNKSYYTCIIYTCTINYAVYMYAISMYS